MTRILPPTTELTQPYWDGCNTNELRLQKCSACAEHQFYPRSFCVHCGSQELQWVGASGQGKVASFTIVRRGISKAYPAPYVVALIDLAEGPRMMSNIIEAEPEQVSVGAAVSVTFSTWAEDTTLPVFRLLEQGVAE